MPKRRPNSVNQASSASPARAVSFASNPQAAARPAEATRPVLPLKRSTAAVRTVLLLGMALGGAGIAAPAAFAQAAAQAADTRHSFNVPAAPLGQTLNAFAAAAGIELTVDSDLLEGRNSRGLAGRYSVEDGFDELLREHGLQAQRTANGSYRLIQAPQLQGGATMLAPVAVTAAIEDGAFTEGTDSFTTSAPSNYATV
ncbi:STN domain-containing protein [Thauera sp. SDU_THAU2]|uniref:STN domain-containing protein n=1 Tax=Thauera sp. SDU_THAU2 TaxID=3136633 RepID=UPI00311F66FB